MKRLLKWIVGTGMVMSMPFAVANSKIEEVFSYDMIGTDLAYLESIIGIARKTNTYNDTKEYVVNGCHLEVGYNGQSIETLSVDLTDRCQFPLKDIISYDETIPSNKVVFGMTGMGTYYADCLYLCGNAYDPAVHELYQGSRAEGFRELLLSSVSDSYEARSKWRDTMMTKEGEDWVLEGRYNCEPYKYSDVASNALKGEKIDQITIGYNLEARKQLQFGCEEFQTGNTQTPVSAPQAPLGIQEIPLTVAYQEADYAYFVGSQILEGEINVFYNEMDEGFQISFTPNVASSQKIGIEPNYPFVLNEYHSMTMEALEDADYFLEFNQNLQDPRLHDYNQNCSIKGNATLQIIGASFYLPEGAHGHVYMRSLKTIQSGPYAISCTVYQ
ncbi:hypothetical protein [Ignatzschineria sp. LJL83]